MAVLAALILSGAVQLDLFVRLLTRPCSLIAATIATFALFPICAWRWHQLMGVAGFELSFRVINRINYQSALVGMYAPGSVGADVAKLAITNLHAAGRMSLLLSTLVVDRLLGLLSLLIIGLVALLAIEALIPPLPDAAHGGDFGKDLMIYIGVALAMSLIGFITMVAVLGRSRQLLGRTRLAWLNRLADTLNRLHEGIILYQNRPLLLVKCLTLSIIGHLADFLALVFIAGALFAVPITPFLYILAGALAAVVSSIPVTPGGIGLGEGAFAQLLDWLAPGNAGVPYATAYLAQRMIRILILLPGLMMPLRTHPQSSP